MEKEIIVSTTRLKMYPLTDIEMENMIEKEQEEGMKQAYSEMLTGCKKDSNNRVWYAVWNMELSDKSGTSVGDLSFKGLDDLGMVEIGYGIKSEYEGQGYMTEAVAAMARWASEQEGVRQVEAETEAENLASKRVLEKAGFVLNGKKGEEGPRYTFVLGA